MAQNRAECTWEIANYGRSINQFQQKIIRSTRQFEMINKKYVDKKYLLYSIKYVLIRNAANVYIHIYICIYIYVCVCVCVCACVCG